MTKKALTLMAIVLMAATALTAATAFAGPRKKAAAPARPQVEWQVAQAVSQSSEALLMLKVRNFQGHKNIGMRLR